MSASSSEVSDAQQTTTLFCIACGTEREQTLEDLVLPVEDDAFADRKIARCPTCDLTTAWPMPSDQELRTFYASLQHGVRTDRPLLRLPLRLWRAKRDADLRRLLRSTAPGKDATILDVGTGSGRLLRVARAAGYRNLIGTDFSQVNVETLRKDGFDAREGSFDDVGLADGSIDVVWASHVVEHMRDPVAFLDAVGRLLSPEGRLVVHLPSSTSLRARTGTSTWHHVNPPGHLWGFSPRSFRSLLERNGYTVDRLGNSLTVCELIAVARPDRTGS